MTEDVEIQEYFANTPQLLSLIYRPRVEIDLIGRGMGKTTEITTNRFYDAIHLMPGCMVIVGCDSFKHLTTVIIPAICSSLEQKGLKQNENYWVDEFPPEGIPRSLQIIPNPKGFIFFDTGAVAICVSTNFQSHANGLSVDFIIWEEAKLLKWGRVKEVNLMNRGNLQHFGHLWCHHGMLVISDMSDDPEHWMYQYYDKQDPELLQLIASLDYQAWKLRVELFKCKNKRRIRELEAGIQELDDKLSFYRSQAVMVMEWSSIQNLPVLGYQTIDDYLNYPVEDVMLNVLSIRPTKSGKYYYASLSDDKHGFVGKNWDYIKTLTAKDDWDSRFDTCDDPDAPLDVAFDWNRHFTCCQVGQMQRRDGRKTLTFLNSFSSTASANIIEACVAEFCKYYQHRKKKVVNLYYDHAGNWMVAGMDKPQRVRAEEAFKAHGWVVFAYEYKQTTHDERFKMWHFVLNDDDEAPFSFAYEKENCTDWYQASKKTLRQIKREMKTDKRSKRRFPVNVIIKNKDIETADKQGKTVPLKLQTHITEAGDGLLVAHYYKTKGKKSISLKIQSRG